MTFLLPAEHFDGADAEQGQLWSVLSRLRAGPQPVPLPYVGSRDVRAAAAITRLGRCQFLGPAWRSGIVRRVPPSWPGIPASPDDRDHHQLRPAHRTADHPYLRALAGFTHDVTGRYRALLRQLAGDPDEFHQHFVAAMVSGDLTELEKRLDARHGPGCFASMFRAPGPVAGRSCVPQRLQP